MTKTRLNDDTNLHVVHVDLDYVFDDNQKQQEINTELLIQRVINLKVNTVFLQAFADPEGNGNIKSLYFPNSLLPVRADLFSQVCNGLRQRAGVNVYAWMPVLAFQLADIPKVLTYNLKKDNAFTDKNQYLRLSPFSAEAESKIVQIYQDLASGNLFDGILFHDDAFLTDFEDACPEAIQACQNAGLSPSIKIIRENAATMQTWTRLKSQALIKLTNTLMAHVRAIRGDNVKSARNLYALPVIEPDSETWFAQNPDDFLENYDWVVPMAMPLMEGVSLADSQAWLTNLVRKIAGRENALERTIIELQSVDWNTSPDTPVTDQTMTDWIRLLQRLGVKNYGYYPDDFFNNQPSAESISSLISGPASD